jgi:hypothetical protein
LLAGFIDLEGDDGARYCGEPLGTDGSVDAR